MKIKKILTITALLTATATQAYQVDLDDYDKDCLKSYYSVLNSIGETSLKGVYLQHKGQDKIKTLYSSLYFNPDYSFNLYFNDMNNVKMRTYNLTENGNVYTFYDKKMNRDKGRNGNKYVITKLNDKEYQFQIFKNSGFIYVDRNYEKSFFEDVVYFDEEKKIDRIIYKREFDSEKSLFQKYTTIKQKCLK